MTPYNFVNFRNDLDALTDFMLGILYPEDGGSNLQKIGLFDNLTGQQMSTERTHIFNLVTRVIMVTKISGNFRNRDNLSN